MPLLPPYDVLVLGAGPAGMMCALTAARRGLHVALVERQEQVGKKLRAAGGGMGNITNRSLNPRYYVGEHPDRCRAALRKFDTRAALALLDQFHIPWEERDFGQIFCLKPAALLAENLLTACRKKGVDLYQPYQVSHIDFPHSTHTAFQIHGEQSLWANHVVMATGSPAWPSLGGTDYGLTVAKQAGHRSIPFHPVLVPFTMPPEWPLLGLEGISLEVRITVKSVGGNTIVDPEDIRPLLFTHQGISGPAALVASCYWHKGDTLIMDFLPKHNVLDLLHDPDQGKRLAGTVLSRYLPARLAERLVPASIRDRKTAELGKQARQELAQAIHCHRVIPSRHMGMQRAEAAAGGVATEDLDSGLQSSFIPGLWFCGEVVDITGLLGGYNIHWALASGHLVGTRIPK